MIIGVGGVSRSGKTVLAKLLKQQLTGSVVLHQDEFNASNLPYINSHVDWEIPDAVDYNSLIRQVHIMDEEHKYVIVEGILIFAHPVLNDCLDKRLVLTMDKEEFIRRKRMDLRWGEEPDWYINHIWECHRKYGFPPKGSEYMLLDKNAGWTPEDVMNYLFSE